MDFTTASLNYLDVENIPKETRRSLVRDTLSLCMVKELKQIFPSEKLAWMAEGLRARSPANGIGQCLGLWWNAFHYGA